MILYSSDLSMLDRSMNEHCVLDELSGRKEKRV